MGEKKQKMTGRNGPSCEVGRTPGGGSGEPAAQGGGTQGAEKRGDSCYQGIIDSCRSFIYAGEGFQSSCGLFYHETLFGVVFSWQGDLWEGRGGGDYTFLGCSALGYKT